MIPVRLDDIPLLYVAAGVGVIFVSWLVVLLTARRRQAAARREAIRCAACGTIFAGDSAVELPRCPACGQPNERIPVSCF